MRFFTAFMATAAFTAIASALPTAESDPVPAESITVDDLDIPIYEIDERDTDNGTSIDIANAPACHIIAYTSDHCGGNTGAPLGIPTGNQGVCVGLGPSSDVRRHSYRVTEACPRVRVFIYIANGCSGTRPHGKTVGAGCHNINTGSRVNSMRAVRA